MKKLVPLAVLVLSACTPPADTARPTTAPAGTPASAPAAATATTPATAPATAPAAIVLHARDVTIHGKTVRYEPEPHKNTIGYWSDATDWVSWDFDVAEPGTYTVEVLQGCGAGSGGAEVEIIAVSSAGDEAGPPGDAEDKSEQRLEFTVEDTGHFQNFVAREVGAFTFDAVGTRCTLSVKPKTKPGVAVMDLRQVTLKPAPD